MLNQPRFAPAAPKQGLLIPALALVVVVIAGSIYANLSFAVTNPATFRYFPPFRPGFNANQNRSLGHEFFNIARAMATGQGFAHPFHQRTGPTAWMPPVLPTLMAGLLWVCDGDQNAVLVIVLFLKACVLVGTGLLVLTLVRQTTRSVGVWIATLVFLVALVCYFKRSFQYADDSWMIMLALDLLLAGLCWFRPLQSWKSALAWGLLGGFCALLSPVVGLTWGAVSLVIGWQKRSGTMLGIAVLTAGLLMVPWTVRNYLVFGHLVPVKSNLAYELYQSQCLQTDGLLQAPTFGVHPNSGNGRESQEFRTLGEGRYLEQKRKQFWDAVWNDPEDFLDRMALRFLGATVWYVPFDRSQATRQPELTFLGRVLHPLPFLAMLVLLFTSIQRPLHGAQWFVIAIYALYLLPYIGASYYERYAFPLLGVKVLLLVWGADRVLWLVVPRPLSKPDAQARE
jgi:hypothetical protein